MPIFAEWKWIEKTETFLVVFNFWDDRQAGKENLRMRLIEEGFETLVLGDAEPVSAENTVVTITIPYCGRLQYPETDAYFSWAPSHSEFCLLTEILTYANLINGLKLDLRKKLRTKLQGKIIRENNQVFFEVDINPIRCMKDKEIVSFSGQDYLSFEVSLEYIEYLRQLINPHI